MVQPCSKVSVCVCEGIAFIRITGRATNLLSLDFKSVVERLDRRELSSFVLELRDCLFMDSTFLGVLAHFALRRHHAEPPLSPPSMFGASVKVQELLDNLGVLPLFRVISVEGVVAKDYEDVDPVAGALSKEALTVNCLEAHRTLMALSPENMERFQDVAHFLADDLERQRSESGASNEA